MQLAHQMSIWVFCLGDLIAEGTVPAQLSAFLANPQIIKVGRNVTTDLKYLQEDFGPGDEFVGGRDIAQLAKSKMVVDDACTGLANLCDKVLKRSLVKDNGIRVSTGWSNNLSEEHKRYAALDAWASLQVYLELDAIQVPVPLDFSQSIPHGTPVYLYHSDQTSNIARGVISPNNPSCIGDKWDGVNVTETRTVIQVDEVYIPGAVITAHRKSALSDFGPTPFHIVCRKAQV